ncbi:MAG TPA: hypothetical protein VI564_01450 [Candidatus Nanoarchaeia archaeon]|nr:hypothetical protein [Candidatus Nanoarchaeia archaeon]
MKKDMNRVFLFLMVVLVLYFVAFTLYYHKNLSSISSKYNIKEKEIITATNEAISFHINETIKMKDIVTKEKEEFDKKYIEKSEENLHLKDEQDTIQSELVSVKADLKEMKTNFSYLRFQYDDILKRFDIPSQQLVLAKSEIEYLRSNFSEIERLYNETMINMTYFKSQLEVLNLRINELCIKINSSNVTDENC